MHSKLPFQSVTGKISLDPKRLFLIDGLGAMLSAFLLGVVLVKFESFFGMPKEVLYWLALAACFFAVFSFSCYWHLPKVWQPYLKAIATANLTYCVVTLALVIYFFPKLTLFGILYFFLEMVVIISLVIFEFSQTKIK